MSLDAEFAGMIAASYTEQPAAGSEQRKQLRAAFYAGALAALVAPAPEVIRDLQAYSGELDREIDRMERVSDALKIR